MMDVNIIEMLKEHEGLRLFPYKCTAGKLTIGYGRNLEDKGITRQEAEDMLVSDVSECIASLYDNIPWYLELTHNRRAVLIDMCFNLGIHGLLKFKNTLHEMKEGNYTRASEMMLESKWATQVGVRARKLSKMMREG